MIWVCKWDFERSNNCNICGQILPKHVNTPMHLKGAMCKLRSVQKAQPKLLSHKWQVAEHTGDFGLAMEDHWLFLNGYLLQFAVAADADKWRSVVLNTGAKKDQITWMPDPSIYSAIHALRHPVEKYVESESASEEYGREAGFHNVKYHWQILAVSENELVYQEGHRWYALRS